MLVFHFLDQMQCEEDPPLVEIQFLTFLSALGWGLKLCENMSLAHGHSRRPRLLIPSLQHLWCFCQSLLGIPT